MVRKICSKCGTQNTDLAQFCENCGNPLVSNEGTTGQSSFACPQCGFALRPGARFCPECGYKIGTFGASASDSKPADGGTRLLEPSDEKVRVIVRWMGGDTKSFDFIKSVLLVGRAPGNDVVINHPSVSGRHLSMSRQQEKFFITDLGSTNGTLVNGQKIAPNTPQRLNLGDVLRIGDLTGNWVSLSLAQEGVEAVRTLAMGKLDLAGQASVLIGRDPAAYLPLSHPTVSFRHAMISKQDSGLVIRDLGSTNGTFVNGQRISLSPLKSGDEIQIGPFKLVYDAQQQSLMQSMRMGHRIDAIQLGREVANKKMILQNISLTVQPGEFIALVGGSGAGKSTLMKAMNGYEPANHGQIFLDGEPLYSKLDLYRTQMGYVPQDDIIHRALPVKLALWYAAKLRLPDARPSEIEARIQDALRSVDMLEHADKPVRVLSGGQRKRVSIAVELLARPTLFFLDEPTSGLDPGLEKKMMYDLNRLADEGRTVVLVTHATANIEQCDHVAFLSYGRLAYYGPPNEALNFYNVHDFSDIYLKLSQDVDPAKGKPPSPELQPYYAKSHADKGKISSGLLWADHYSQSPFNKKYVLDRQSQLKTGGYVGAAGSTPPRKSKDSFIRQTVILARRQFDLIRLDWRTLFILLLMMPLIGGLFMMVSKKDDFTGRPGTVTEIKRSLMLELEGANVGDKSEYTPTATAEILVTMLGLALTQGGTFGAAYEIVKERAIFKRERAVNLSVLAYVLSKVLILGGFAIIQVASVLLVMSLKVDLNVQGAVFKDAGIVELYITLYLAVFASILFGLFLSAIVPTTDVVLYAILVQLFVQIILGGTLFPLDSGAASKFTISYWTMDAMGSTVDMARLNRESMACSVVEIPSMTGGDPVKDIRCDSIERSLYLDYEHTSEHVVNMWMGLLAHAIFWGLLTIVVQARKKIE